MYRSFSKISNLQDEIHKSNIKRMRELGMDEQADQAEKDRLK